jgi:hypothetical protein
MRKLGVIAVALTLLAVAVGWAQAQTTPPSIDVFAGTLNERPLRGLTVDAVTDLFGRPTAVQRGIEGLTGAQVHYHETGLSFWFHPAKTDPREGLFLMSVYLSRSWDKKFALHYKPFSGQLSPAVDGNWKADRLMREFADHNPVVDSAEAQQRSLDSMRLGIRLPPSQDAIRVKRDGRTASFHLDPVTKFLERISVALGH